jgi:hypothetical protein
VAFDWDSPFFARRQGAPDRPPFEVKECTIRSLSQLTPERPDDESRAIPNGRVEGRGHRSLVDTLVEPDCWRAGAWLLATVFGEELLKVGGQCDCLFFRRHTSLAA